MSYYGRSSLGFILTKVKNQYEEPSISIVKELSIGIEMKNISKFYVSSNTFIMNRARL